ncbi:hypothetical protein JDBV08_00670 [Mycobacterium phage jiawei]|uniref:hypothetical protein n=1 Tax=Brevundimonas diminuta TaxID=293 RepID=UPI0019065F1C|nr:hypothetical protein [Brevundimonas diminuta]MBK1968387.1 hypothetical protein [Brevundimonas diminuta]WRQ08301.1 hypothetical protein JDBV08_00670 [Mycobacterium phage jiawei]
MKIKTNARVNAGFKALAILAVCLTVIPAVVAIIAAFCLVGVVIDLLTPVVRPFAPAYEAARELYAAAFTGLRRRIAQVFA